LHWKHIYRDSDEKSQVVTPAMNNRLPQYTRNLSKPPNSSRHKEVACRHCETTEFMLSDTAVEEPQSILGLRRNALTSSRQGGDKDKKEPSDNPKPRGLDALDPTLPPSNNFQNVVEENSTTTEFHIKDGPNLLTFPPTSILVTDFIASTQNHNIVVYDEMHPKSEEVFKQKNQAPQSDYIYRIDESIPKAQMGYVFPSTSSNARVTHSRNPPQHYPKQHPTDCFDTLKYIQSMMKNET